MIEDMQSVLLFQSQKSAIEFNTWMLMVLILFSLSLIAERVANMVKIYAPGLRKSAYGLSTDKNKERSMLWITLFSSLLISAVAYADFFYIIAEGQLANLENNPVSLRSLVGVFLSALLINFGSKFWHDILDIIFHISNLKRFTVIERGHELNTQIHKLSTSRRDELAKKVKSISPRLQAFQGYSGYKVVTYENGQTIAQLMFTQNPPNSKDRDWINNVLNEAYEIIMVR